LKQKRNVAHGYGFYLRSFFVTAVTILAIAISPNAEVNPINLEIPKEVFVGDSAVIKARLNIQNGQFFGEEAWVDVSIQDSGISYLSLIGLTEGWESVTFFKPGDSIFGSDGALMAANNALFSGYCQALVSNRPYEFSIYLNPKRKGIIDIYYRAYLGGKRYPGRLSFTVRDQQGFMALRKSINVIDRPSPLPAGFFSILNSIGFWKWFLFLPLLYLLLNICFLLNHFARACLIRFGDTADGLRDLVYIYRADYMSNPFRLNTNRKWRLIYGPITYSFIEKLFYPASLILSRYSHIEKMPIFHAGNGVGSRISGLSIIRSPFSKKCRVIVTFQTGNDSDDLFSRERDEKVIEDRDCAEIRSYKYTLSSTNNKPIRLPMDLGIIEMEYVY